MLTSIEVCAGAGGQALGLEGAGFDHIALVEIDPHACATLRHNRPEWRVIQADLRGVTRLSLGVETTDLLAGGVPCPPFSVAGKQLGEDDDRDLFPEMIRLARELNPRAIMIENVRGLLQSRFDGYRSDILDELKTLGYVGEWRLVQAADFGVAQMRARSVLVAMKRKDWNNFAWPDTYDYARRTVGDVLLPMMAANGWPNAEAWAQSAQEAGPTLVGGSKKHGGADLGPTRAKQAWRQLNVDGMGLANEPPGIDFVGIPKLTVPMAAALQGFPANWHFAGRKTASYRQVGNAFPPPVAEAVGICIARALNAAQSDVAERTAS
jgi:DNA (cytosine-5)-methyltransferase 1